VDFFYLGLPESDNDNDDDNNDNDKHNSEDHNNDEVIMTQIPLQYNFIIIIINSHK